MLRVILTAAEDQPHDRVLEELIILHYHPPILSRDVIKLAL